jgi:hypothetical protein
LPTRPQLVATHAVVAWYVARHFGTAADPGTLATFTDPARVGAFAVTIHDLRREEPAALFRLLVATTLFQRQRDLQILRILREMADADVAEIGDARRLGDLADGCACPHASRLESLLTACDLTKDAEGRGTCGARPGTRCHLKRHTVALRRYGHFGKVPTSAALLLRELGVGSLGELRARVLREVADPHERALRLEAYLCRSWRISQKIAAMYVSLLANPDLGIGVWSEGLDWAHFTVIDSNVDLFLESIGYSGRSSYNARREFVCALARRIDLTTLDMRLAAYNPRVVQQALYLFMSVSNRRELASDCASEIGACAACPSRLRRRCLLRHD